MRGTKSPADFCNMYLLWNNGFLKLKLMFILVFFLNLSTALIPIFVFCILHSLYFWALRCLINNNDNNKHTLLKTI